MKLLDVINELGKDKMYMVYSALLMKQARDYERVTRKKMIQEMLWHFEHYPTSFASFLSFDELTALEHLLEHKNDADDYPVFLSLQDLYILDENFHIYEEFVEIVENSIKTVDWKSHNIKSDEFDIVVGILRIYGILPADFLMKLLETVFDLSIDLENSYLRRFYYLTTESITDQDSIIIFTPYIDVVEEIIEQISGNKKDMKIYDLEEIKIIGRYGLNVLIPEIAEIRNQQLLNKGEHSTDFYIEQFKEMCAVGYYDFEYLLPGISFINPTLLNAFDKAAPFMPCAAFMGNNMNGMEQDYIQAQKDSTNEDEVIAMQEVYYALIDYANEKLDCFEDFEMAGFLGQIDEFSYIRRELYDNKQLFDQFIAENPLDFDDEQLDIVLDFKRGMLNEYIIMKHEEDYSVFVDESERFYAVKGLNNTVEQSLGSNEIPVFVEALLVPIFGEIRYDGILTRIDYNFDQEFINEIEDLLESANIIKTFSVVN